jgi:hypothetical protein
MMLFAWLALSIVIPIGFHLTLAWFVLVRDRINGLDPLVAQRRRYLAEPVCATRALTRFTSAFERARDFPCQMHK